MYIYNSVCYNYIVIVHISVKFADIEIARKILQATEPKVMKKLGREVKKFDAEIWDNICVKIVRRGNMAKVHNFINLYLFFILPYIELK